jgi:hypothetical protein
MNLNTHLSDTLVSPYPIPAFRSNLPISVSMTAYSVWVNLLRGPRLRSGPSSL